ncbi:MAG TPA: hypothetical protein VGS22_03460 [Thermoanaerobaculia bacterium]|nr:hypothetical protein [Thermoanaerobaculia bacterium]
MSESVGNPEKVFDAEEMRKFVEELLAERKKSALLPPGENPFFKDHEVYHGSTPADLSERHDDYLYGDDKKS